MFQTTNQFCSLLKYHVSNFRTDPYFDGSMADLEFPLTTHVFSRSQALRVGGLP